MTPDVVVDIGNTRMKWGRCEAGRVTQTFAMPLDSPAAWTAQFAAWDLDTRRLTWVVASVNPAVTARFSEWVASFDGILVQVGHFSQVPLQLAVQQPEKVGIDRLLTALAANRMADERPAIVVNIGTAVTCDLVDDAGTFLGGAIFPGPQLMARSLHDYTAKLPLIDAGNLHTVNCPGRDTQQAIELGIASAVGSAIMRLIAVYSEQLDSPPVVFFTGGGMEPFTDVEADEMWTPDPNDTRFVPTLTLEGIRLAAEEML